MIEIFGIVKAWKKNLETGLITPIHHGVYKKNLTPDIYPKHLAMLGAGESVPDLEITYLSIASKFDAPARDQGTLGSTTLELGRVAATIERTLGKNVVTATFGASDGNTEVKNIDTVSSSTEFILDSVTGLAEGNLIRARIGNEYQYRKITDITSSTITINKAFTTDPAVNDDIEQCLNHFIASYAGTGALNTGFAAAIAELPRTTKSSNEQIVSRHEILFKPT